MKTNRLIIRGIGTALPEKVLGNDELLRRFERFDIAPFLNITGIKERRVIATGESASDLGVCAAQSLLTTSGIDRNEIDALIYLSLTADHRTPPTSCFLQHRLGLSQRVCTFDLVQTCPAFVHELAIVTGLQAIGVSKTALVVHSETLSQLIHPMDHELVPIHGDGAVAILYQPTDSGGTELEWFDFGTDGSLAELVIVPEGMSRKPFSKETLQEKEDENGAIRCGANLKINGAAVFHFVIHSIPKFLKNTLEAHSTSLDDYDLILFHQANKMIVDMLYNMLKIPTSKRFYSLETVGNLSGVSIPFLLAEAIRTGKLVPGARVLICGFGAGMNWGAVSLRWQENDCLVAPNAIFSLSGNNK